jgi:hypothetical protein
VARSETTLGLLLPFTYGKGNPEYVNVATPAAGATASYTVDGKFAVRVLAARLSITTDANAANRLVTLDYIDERNNTRLRNGAGLVVTANTSAQTFEFDAHRGVAEWAANTPVFSPLAPFFLYPGFSVKFNVTNIQVGDAISALSLWLEQFQTGPRGYVLGVAPDPDFK